MVRRVVRFEVAFLSALVALMLALAPAAWADEVLAGEARPAQAAGASPMQDVPSPDAPAELPPSPSGSIQEEPAESLPADAPATPPQEAGEEPPAADEVPAFDVLSAQPTAAVPPASSPAVPAEAAPVLSAQAVPADPAATGGAGSARVVEDGEYYLESARNLALVLDMSGASRKDGGNAIVWTFTGGGNQRWGITFDAGSGCYYLVNVNSGKVLDVAGAKAAPGANVLQWSRKSALGANQLWRISYDAATGYTFTSALRSDLVLGIQGGSAGKGGNVQVQEQAAASWQRWWLIPVNPQVNGIKTLDTGIYAIARKDAPEQLVDVAGVSQDDGANVDIWQSNGGANQKWAIIRETGDFYRIVSVASGKALDIAGAAMTANANVLQWRQKGSDNQKWAIRENGDGSYSIISKLNGLALSATGSKDGSNVRTWFANGADHEKFVIRPVQALSDGVYSIGMRANPGKVVDVPGKNLGSGVKLAIWSYNGGLNQKYQVTHMGGDVYTIQAGHSGALLADSGGSIVQAARDASSTAQHWRAMWKGSGLSLVNVASGRALNAAGGSTKDGTALQAATASNAASQQFALVRRDVLDGGMYTLHSYAGARVIDIAGASKADGANAALWKANGNNNQKFQITAAGGGYFKMVNVASGKALDVAGASRGSGANVLQWTYKGSANQLWKPEISPNGGIVFVNKNSGKVLEVAGGIDKKEANIRVADSTGAKGQRWALDATTRKVEDAVLERALKIANGKRSSTKYLITVDLSKHRTIVFQRSGNSWKAVKNWACTTGAPSTPTVRGDFTIGSRGYSFGSGYTCYYWTQFHGNYLFHSVLYNEGTRTIQDGRLGKSLSHGCVRLDIDNAKWINKNIPSGTKVVTYK